MQLSAVKEACCAYLLEILDEDHAACTLSLAAKYSCEELQSRAAAFASERFHGMRPDALRECARPLLAGLVERDDLSVHSEIQAGSPLPAHATPHICALLPRTMPRNVQGTPCRPRMPTNAE